MIPSADICRTVVVVHPVLCIDMFRPTPRQGRVEGLMHHPKNVRVSLVLLSHTQTLPVLRHVLGRGSLRRQQSNMGHTYISKWTKLQPMRYPTVTLSLIDLSVYWRIQFLVTLTIAFTGIQSKIILFASEGSGSNDRRSAVSMSDSLRELSTSHSMGSLILITLEAFPARTQAPATIHAEPKSPKNNGGESSKPFLANVFLGQIGR